MTYNLSKYPLQSQTLLPPSQSCRFSVKDLSFPNKTKPFSTRLVTLIKTKPIGFWVLEKMQALRDRAMEEEAPGIMVLPTAGISYGTSFFPLLISSSSLCSPIASSPHRSDEGFTRSLALVTVQFLT